MNIIKRMTKEKVHVSCKEGIKLFITPFSKHKSGKIREEGNMDSKN